MDSGRLALVASSAMLPMLHAAPHEGDHAYRHQRGSHQAQHDVAVGGPPGGAGDREASSSSLPSCSSPLLMICTPSGIPAMTPAMTSTAIVPYRGAGPGQAADQVGPADLRASARGGGPGLLLQ